MSNYYMTEEEKDELFLQAKEVLERVGIYGIESWDQLDNWRRFENDDIQLEKRIAEALCEYDG
jgi:hypothetical protein